MYNLWVASYAINEIKDFDSYTGGSTKVAVLYDQGFKELAEEKVLEFYNQAVDSFSGEIRNVIGNKVKIKKDRFRKLFPKG
jgi:hypothetical protein